MLDYDRHASALALKVENLKHLIGLFRPIMRDGDLVGISVLITTDS